MSVVLGTGTKAYAKGATGKDIGWDFYRIIRFRSLVLYLQNSVPFFIVFSFVLRVLFLPFMLVKMMVKRIDPTYPCEQHIQSEVI